MFFAQVFLAFQSHHLSTLLEESDAIVCNLSLLSYFIFYHPSVGTLPCVSPFFTIAVALRRGGLTRGKTLQRRGSMRIFIPLLSSRSPCQSWRQRLCRIVRRRKRFHLLILQSRELCHLLRRTQPSRCCRGRRC